MPGVNPRRAGGTGRTLVMGKFALFAECVVTGVLLTLALVPVVTALAGTAASCRHLRRSMRGDGATLAEFAADFRSAWRGSWGLSLLGPLALALLLANTAIAQAGLPGGPLVVAVTAAAVLAALVAGLRAAAAWQPGAEWAGLARAAALRTLRGDLAGSALLAAGLVLLALVTWQLAPLFIPMVGCLAGAAVAVEGRARR